MSGILSKNSSALLSYFSLFNSVGTYFVARLQSVLVVAGRDRCRAQCDQRSPTLTSRSTTTAAIPPLRHSYFANKNAAIRTVLLLLSTYHIVNFILTTPKLITFSPKINLFRVGADGKHSDAALRRISISVGAARTQNCCWVYNAGKQKLPFKSAAALAWTRLSNLRLI
jgi:hypothetical protein